jgi:hypothetical protein
VSLNPLGITFWTGPCKALFYRSLNQSALDTIPLNLGRSTMSHESHRKRKNQTRNAHPKTTTMAHPRGNPIGAPQNGHLAGRFETTIDSLQRGQLMFLICCSSPHEVLVASNESHTVLECTDCSA